MTAAWLGGTLSQPARLAMIGTILYASVAMIQADLRVDADPEATAGYLLVEDEHRQAVIHQLTSGRAS